MKLFDNIHTLIKNNEYNITTVEKALLEDDSQDREAQFVQQQINFQSYIDRKEAFLRQKTTTNNFIQVIEIQGISMHLS